VEKIVGLQNDESLACPKKILSIACSQLDLYKSPTELDADQIPEEGIKIIRDYLDFLQNTVEHLERNGQMTMGLDDHLYSSANAHETYMYLLQQRNKLGR
jgi:hypothetical protein